MNSETVDKFLLGRIEAGDFPSAAYLVARKGRVEIMGALGNAVIEPVLLPAKNNTIYDVASLTKVLVTGLLIAILVENGEISLDDSAADHLAEMAVDGKADITIGQLVTHTSNLPAWLPLYLISPNSEEILDTIARTQLMAAGRDTVYSDLNFILLGKIIERITGHSLDDSFEDMVTGPLGLSDTMYIPFDLMKRRISASEKGRNYERQASLGSGYESENLAVFVDDVIWGSVHDGNASFMGGVAGHAGLFSTVNDTYRLAQQFIKNETTLLQPDTCTLFVTDLTPGSSENRSVGFQLAATPQSTAGSRMSPKSFGHLGFTGTSLWIDPISESIFILFTNRTHARQPPFANINEVRRRFHELAAAELDQIDSN